MPTKWRSTLNSFHVACTHLPIFGGATVQAAALADIAIQLSCAQPIEPYLSGIILPMRRFFALLILLVLPLQWSYAAVGDYCQHEALVAAQKHVGHHAHKHVDKSPEDKLKKVSFGDLDCPSCQHSTPAALPQLPTTPVPHFSAAPIIFLSQSIPHRSPDNPFRPPLAIRP